ncbi:hypothetical protein RB653_010104 [Dictyostelium firmibasis]|uniref:FNIP repeat-containing protein n=1 Tax=Dictyostelium firmibasis TaxID=79012 RepID=A0AAN7YVA6_9MYCE
MEQDKLFFKIFRNKYLKKQIFYHVRLYNNNYHTQDFTMESLAKYPMKEYLRSIVIKDYQEQDQQLMNNLLNSLPNIEILESEKDYNKTLPSVSVSSIRSIKFGEKFDQPIVCYTLPMLSIKESLTSLVLGESFNQPIDFQQLVNLKTLVFGNFFNQALKPTQLPKSLTYLEFGHAYNQKIPYGVLPTSLETLKLGPSFNKMIFSKQSKRKRSSSLFFKLLPSFKTECDENKCKSKKKHNHQQQPNHQEEEENDDKTLKNLKVLELGEYFNGKLKSLGKLPNSLESIRFGGIFNQKLSNMSKLTSLKSLRFGRLFNQNIDSLPPFLTSISFSFHFNSEIKESSIPPTLKKIVFGYMYNRPIGFLKSTNVESITFGHNFDQPFVCEKTNQSLLPESLTYLDLRESTRFDQPFDKPNSLPPKLKSLHLFKRYKRNMVAKFLPPTLENFVVSITESNPHYLDQNLPISKIIFKTNLVIVKSDQKKPQGLPFSIKSSTPILKIEFDYFYLSAFNLFKIPETVEQVSFNFLFDVSTLKQTVFPRKLKSLHLTYMGERELILDRHSLPHTITSLYINNIKPTSIKILSLPNSINEIYCKYSNVKFINYCLNHNLYNMLKIID